MYTAISINNFEVNNNLLQQFRLLSCGLFFLVRKRGSGYRLFGVTIGSLTAIGVIKLNISRTG